jgi:RNA polymerase sigma-70 factor, ECF subfamily
MPPGSDTAQLLRQWHGGDRQALEVLLAQDLPWIERRVRRRLGPLLHAKAETADFVQEAVLEVLRYTPRFVITDRGRFRALLARIVENVLRDQHDRFTAYRRALHRERPLPADSQLVLDPPVRGAPSPSQAAQREEWEAWIRLALELSAPEDRLIILLRQWDGVSFEEIGRGLGIAADAARMRYNRALARLAHQVCLLKGGKLPAALDGEEGERGDG